MTLDAGLDEARGAITNIINEVECLDISELDCNNITDSLSDLQDLLDDIYADDAQQGVIEDLGIGFLANIVNKISLADRMEIERVVKETCCRLGYIGEVNA